MSSFVGDRCVSASMPGAGTTHFASIFELLNALHKVTATQVKFKFMQQSSSSPHIRLQLGGHFSVISAREVVSYPDQQPSRAILYWLFERYTPCLALWKKKRPVDFSPCPDVLSMYPHKFILIERTIYRCVCASHQRSVNAGCVQLARAVRILVTSVKFSAKNHSPRADTDTGMIW